MGIKKKWIALTVVVCVVGGASLLMVKSKKKEPTTKTKEHIALIDDIRVSIDGEGEAKLEETDYKFQIGGTLEKVYVNKGDKVKKGDKLAKLSNADINTKIEELKIEQSSKSDELNQLKSQKENAPEDTSIDSQINSAQGEINKINKKIENLKSDLNKLYIYADSSGVVLDIKGEVGTTITPANQIMVIGNENKMYLEVLLPQTDIVKVREEQPVKVTFETYPDIEVDGVVKEKSYTSSGKNEDVDYKVKVELDSKDIELYQGMTAEVDFIIKNKENVLQIPSKAILNKDKKQIVKVKDGDEIKEVEVKTGFSDGKVTQILEGLKENQVVIEERNVGDIENSGSN